MRSAARVVSGLVFLTLVATIWGGMHWYAWTRLVWDAALPPPVPLAAGVLVALFAFGTLLVPMGVAPRRIASAAWTAAFVWAGFLFLLVVVLGFGDALRAILSATAGAQSANPGDVSSVPSTARMQAAASLATAIALSIIAFVEAHRAPVARDLEITLDRLPRAFDGFRIAQITDLHISPNTRPGAVAALVERVNADAPDLVALTGDLVDGSPAALADSVAPLAGLRAKHGAFVVLGNHECYSGPDRWLATYRALGLRVLQNERVPITRGDAAFELAGVPDWHGASFGPRHAPRLADALAGRDAGREVVLLAHQPRQFREAASLDVGLQLSGHTHGGQLWPFTLVVALAERFVAGHYRRGRSQLYVSRGTGSWGPPMRLGAPHELTRITLRARGA